MARARRSRPAACGCPASAAAAAQVVEDLDLVGLAVLDEPGPTSQRLELVAHERVVGSDRRRHPRLDGGKVVRGQRSRQLEVVVEAALDGRPDAELRAGEQVHHGLGHDVRRRVAHRVEGIPRAGVEELLGRAALGRHEQLVVEDRVLRCCVFVVHRRGPPGHENSLSSLDRTKGRAFRGPTRLRRGACRGALVAALTGDARAGSPAAHGWWRHLRHRPGLSAVALALWRCYPRRASRSTRSASGGRHWTRTSDLLHVKQVL